MGQIRIWQPIYTIHRLRRRSRESQRYSPPQGAPVAFTRREMLYVGRHRVIQKGPWTTWRPRPSALIAETLPTQVSGVRRSAGSPEPCSLKSQPSGAAFALVLGPACPGDGWEKLLTASAPNHVCSVRNAVGESNCVKHRARRVVGREQAT